MEDLNPPRYGKRPVERTMEEMLEAGVVVIDKPQGPTSHQVSAWTRDLLGAKKAAHGGTLDPRVTGVLAIALNDAVRAIDALHAGHKVYVGVMRLHQEVPEERVTKVMKEFVGDIYQMPPVRAAVKRQLRVRRIHELNILDRLGRDYLFRVRCEAGTYIRTLCVDLGEALGVGAHLQDLRRTRTASFAEEDAVSLDDLRDAYLIWKDEGNQVEIRKLIRPVEDMLRHLKRVVVKDTAVDAICHGASLAAPGIMEIDDRIVEGSLVSILTRQGEAIALGNAKMGSHQMISAGSGLALELERVLMKPGTYPKLWK
ncbi:MAG: RNA-guided pseudouridylation complex pseudouridine synthase subunit Cbf5 [Thermoplasmata archaeon]